MAITFRHDAAAVALPSNSAGKKYGQQLVLQQQQQKYQGQQAGYDRLLQVGRDQQQNNFQVARDNMQQVAQMGRDFQQNDFANARAKQQNEWQQQQQEADRQRAFMEDARKQSSGMIMDDIKNGEFDPVTSRKLQQNIVAESEALGNQNLDATQRAEALAKIRAERTLLTANRQQKAPPPTAQEQFDQGIVVGPDGAQYRQNSKGDFEPLPQQQPQQPMSTRQKFGADPKLADKWVEEAIADLKGDGTKPFTKDRKAIYDKAIELYEERQAAFSDTPTLMPARPGAPADTRTERSILEAPGIPVTAPDAGQPPAPAPAGIPVTQPDAGSPPMPAGGQQPDAAAAARHEDMTRQGYMLKDMGDGVQRYYKVDSTPQTTDFYSGTPAASSQNPWSEVASGEPQREPIPLTSNASSQTPAGTAPSVPMTANSYEQTIPAPAQQAPAKAPDFTALSASAKNDADRSFLSQVQTVYQGQSPEVQAAIGVFLSQDSLDDEFIAARDFLKAAGIDMNQLAAESSKTTGEKTRDKMKAKYGETYDSF